MVSRSDKNAYGFTIVELMVVMTVISVLASAILPLSQMAVKRTKEIELRRALREIRTAIDEYKKAVDEGKIAKDVGDSGYPETLEVLVEGVDLGGQIEEKRKFLRRIPRDPLVEDGEWGLRSYSDDPEAMVWNGEDVYDVYSGSEGTAIDGTKYSEW